ncbi:DUF6702 family protein [Aquimarina hainanensis]|uniref:DUF6702 family protein n=1 Tax=Aquimarina hainanensis TaxID=1578017 RepID=A0ABW5N937_9FLAO|nr:DUF6702 family protein [Aquimarina sp. TRL1]QKX05578.1 peptidase E [Aquimarina sp. TRL1]
MKKKALLGLVMMVIVVSSFTTLHKFYVSVTQIEYKEEEKSLQVISRVFIDDLEKVMRERYDESLTFLPEGEDPMVVSYLESYFRQKLIIRVNGEEVSCSFLGKEYENDLVLCYFEVLGVSGLDEIEVTNQALMDVFEEQQNIIHIKKGKERKSLILEKERESGLVKF